MELEDRWIGYTSSALLRLSIFGKRVAPAGGQNCVPRSIQPLPWVAVYCLVTPSLLETTEAYRQMVEDIGGRIVQMIFQSALATSRLTNNPEFKKWGREMGRWERCHPVAGLR